MEIFDFSRATLIITFWIVSRASREEASIIEALEEVIISEVEVQVSRMPSIWTLWCTLSQTALVMDDRSWIRAREDAPVWACTLSYPCRLPQHLHQNPHPWAQPVGARRLRNSSEHTTKTKRRAPLATQPIATNEDSQSQQVAQGSKLFHQVI